MCTCFWFTVICSIRFCSSTIRLIHPILYLQSLFCCWFLLFELLPLPQISVLFADCSTPLLCYHHLFHQPRVPSCIAGSFYVILSVCFCSALFSFNSSGSCCIYHLILIIWIRHILSFTTFMLWFSKIILFFNIILLLESPYLTLHQLESQVSGFHGDTVLSSDLWKSRMWR